MKMKPPHNQAVSVIAREIGLSEATLHQWRRQARSKGMAVPGGEMSTIPQIEKIGYDKLDILLSMYREKAEWLNRIGQPMWSMEYLKKENFIKKYNDPECFITYINDIPIGGFILVKSDNFLWGPDSHLGAYYIHKLVVKNGYTGQGNAQKMISWIEEYAGKAGKEKVRLDCYEDRKYLLQLYTSCGFNLLEVKIMPDGTRIAQYEKSFKEKLINHNNQ